MDARYLHHILDAAGPQAAHIEWLWWLTLAICAIVFAAVLIALAIALRNGGRRRRAVAAAGGDNGGDALGRSDDGPDLSSLSDPERGTVKSVSIATGLSAALLIVLVVASVVTDRALARLDLADGLHVKVTALQWWWNVRYDDSDPSKIFSTANELHVPVGRPVIVSLESSDVIHSFWIPSLHGKKDLIPGQTTAFQLRADRAGTYRGQCAEFCGVQHAQMAFTVVAEPPDAFERWAAQQRTDAPEATGPAARRGRELFLSGSCMLCHAIQGTDGGGRNAPDLTHVASRPTLAAGAVANTPENLARWIANPQAIKPGVNMPAHPLPDADMQALVAYLGTLK